MVGYRNWSHYSPGKSPSIEDGMFRQSPREFVCGWGAASINIIMTFPINKLMFRQMLHGIPVETAWRQLQREGVLHLYRGLLPPFFQKTTSLAIMFGMYDRYQYVLHKHSPEIPVIFNRGFAAILAGCTEAVLTPFERIQTLMQDKNYHGKFRNTFHAFRELHQHYGFREFYRGLVPILLRNGPSNVMFFLLRGEIKNRLPQTDTRTGDMAADFVSGGILGAFISTVFYPINVVKTRMQARVGGPFIGFYVTFVTVFRERRGWRGMFLGVHVNFTRSLISWGIINAAYELLKKTLYPEMEI